MLDALRNNIDIAAVAKRLGVTLRRKGANLFGLCPLHSERTPSFSVSPQKQIYKCFGCGEGGDAIDLVSKVLGVPFPDAVQWICDEFNIENPLKKNNQNPADMEDVRKCLTEAWSFLRQQAKGMRTPPALRASSVEFGALPERSYDLISILKNSGFKDDIITRAGLISERGKPVLYGKRYVIAIYDEYGNIVGFAARSLDNSKPKWINTRFAKDRYLYGLDKARANIRREGIAILTEGYTDVVRERSHGKGIACACMGSNLSDAQASKVLRYCKRIVLAFDGDSAGRKGAFKAFTKLLQKGAEVLLYEIPEGEDLGSMSPNAVRNLTSNAQNAFDVYVAMAMAVKSPHKRAEKLKVLSDVVAGIEDEVLRAQYAAEFGRITGVTLEKQNKENKGKTTEQKRGSLSDAEAVFLSKLIAYVKDLQTPTQLHIAAAKKIRDKKIRSAVLGYMDGAVNIKALLPAITAASEHGYKGIDEAAMLVLKQWAQRSGATEIALFILANVK